MKPKPEMPRKKFLASVFYASQKIFCKKRNRTLEKFSVGMCIDDAYWKFFMKHIFTLRFDDSTNNFSNLTWQARYQAVTLYSLWSSCIKKFITFLYSTDSERTLHENCVVYFDILSERDAIIVNYGQMFVKHHVGGRKIM
jgi:hypothetical protein